MSDVLEISWIHILLAVFAVIVPIVLYTIGKRKKKLICKLFPSLSLVDVRTEVKDRIKIYYDDNLVENLSMTKVKIKNNGNLPIRKEHVVKPLEFNFGENLSVIDYRVINTEPKGITVNLELNNENNLIRCPFDLLNPSDEFTLQFVCLGESEELPNITARIEGIKQIGVETLSVSEEKFERMKRLGIVYIAGGFFMFIIAFALYPIHDDVYLTIIYSVMGIITVIFGILIKKGYFPHKIHFPLLAYTFGKK